METTIHKPVDWYVTFEDGTHYESAQGDWSDIAELELVDRTYVWTTKKRVCYLSMVSSGHNHVIYPCLDRQMFSFARFGTSIDPSGAILANTFPKSRWIFTLFGFLLSDELRFVCRVLPGGQFVTRFEDRSTPIHL